MSSSSSQTCSLPTSLTAAELAAAALLAVAAAPLVAGEGAAAPVAVTGPFVENAGQWPAEIRYAADVADGDGDLVVTSRSSNDAPAGTYGQLIAGVPEAEAVGVGSDAVLPQLSRSLASGSGYRTNLGVVNVTGSALAVEVGFFDAGGGSLGTATYSVPAYGSIQRNNVFQEVTGEEVDGGYAVVRTTTPGGRFLAYASVVDNRSGDPVYIPAR